MNTEQLKEAIDKLDSQIGKIEIEKSKVRTAYIDEHKEFSVDETVEVVKDNGNFMLCKVVDIILTWDIKLEYKIKRILLGGDRIARNHTHLYSTWKLRKHTK